MDSYIETLHDEMNMKLAEGLKKGVQLILQKVDALIDTKV